LTKSCQLLTREIIANLQYVHTSRNYNLQLANVTMIDYMLSSVYLGEGELPVKPWFHHLARGCRWSASVQADRNHDCNHLVIKYRKWSIYVRFVLFDVLANFGVWSDKINQAFWRNEKSRLLPIIKFHTVLLIQLPMMQILILLSLKALNWPAPAAAFVNVPVFTQQKIVRNIFDNSGNRIR